MAMMVGACTTDPVFCEPECGADAPFCGPLGTCVECLMDSDCGGTAPVCAPSANVCVDCVSDEDCGPDFVCQDAVCTLDCPLPYGRERNADGGCEGCASDDDCAAGVCRDDFCQVPSCADAPDPDLYCFIAAFEELPRDGCQLHDLVLRFDLFSCGGAPMGMAPVSSCDPCYASLGGCEGCDEEGQCSCAVDADCPPPTVCDEGTCAHVDCWEDDDCACGEYCDGGLCRRECATDDDCIEGRCHEPSGRCLECLSDDDCPAGWRCYEDGCVLPCTIEPCDGRRCTESGRCSDCAGHDLGLDPGLAPAECAP